MVCWDHIVGGMLGFTLMLSARASFLPCLFTITATLLHPRSQPSPGPRDSGRRMSGTKQSWRKWMKARWVRKPARCSWCAKGMHLHVAAGQQNSCLDS